MSMSPMMIQYLKIKEQNKDALLFFRLGDFYEMFFEDALTASKELELTLTGRDCGMDERAPMCGVPYHAVESYIAKLIEKGFKVAICEQMTLPGETKGIVERDIVRVVTPGTVIESSMLNEEKNNYLASVCYDDGKVGVSWVDITTGEFNHMLIEESISMKLNDLLSRIQPSEIICNEQMLGMSVELSIVKYGNVCKFSLYNDWAYDFDTAEEALSNQLGKDGIKILQNKSLCIRSAGALVQYVKDTQKRALSHITAVNVENLQEYMILDYNARRTLELTENVADNKKKGSLLWVLDKTSTNMGARMLRKWIEQPSINACEINRRLNGVEELKTNLILRDSIKAILSSVKDIERLTGRLSYGNINPRDCLALAQSLASLPNLTNELKKCRSPILADTLNNIQNFDSLVELVLKAIVEQPPIVIRDGGMIADNFDNELDEYKNISKNSKEILAELERAEKEETGIKNLKIGFNRIFGYYIEVLKSQVDLVPYRYIRKQTIANGERYITEELKDIESKILHSEERATVREIEIYNSIVREMFKFISPILSTAHSIAILDCLVSNAIVSSEMNYVKPVINDEIKHIKILEGRHSVVEKLIKGEEYVPNDTFLDSDKNKTMIITGPNMAGKSVYMRQVAVIVILAHMGCFVPAKSAEIALTDRIFTRVGASDDLSTGRSTFMVEMTEVSYILENATNNSLILLDEIGRGTSTYDGLSIAWAIIEYISENLTAKTLFSTHYHELTELEDVLPGLKNYKLTIREYNNTIIFLRKIMRGSANKSFGIEVASLAGLPNIVVVRAKELLGKLENADIGRQAKMATNQQISIFNSSISNEILSILKDLDVDNISPRQAQDILIDLIEKSKK